MGEIEDIAREEAVVHLLEEAEKAMRLAADLEGAAKKEVQDALESLWVDIGRMVYNAYWKEDLLPGESGAELAQFTSEIATETVPVRAAAVSELNARREPGPNDLPGFDPDPAIGDLGGPEETGWYTSDVEIPDRPLFTESDGLEEALPDDD